jgi:hypothetical protein
MKAKPSAAAATALPADISTWERPPLLSNPSFDSTSALNGTPTEQKSVGDDGDEAVQSEAGDDESVVGSVKESASPSGRVRGGKSGRGRPRKSKLAQEIVPADSGGEA